MFQTAFKSLFPSKPVRFYSVYPLDISVARLRNAVKKGVFAGVFSCSVGGEVSVENVELEYAGSWRRGQFKPIFVGEFVDEQQGVALVGRFTIFSFTKLFMAFWLGCCLLWTFGMTWTVLKTLLGLRPLDPAGWSILLFPPFGACFCLLGYLFIHYGWWRARGDIETISAVITGALSLREDTSELETSE